MMKLLFCEDCRDLVRPVAGKPREPRFCMCARHAIWGVEKGSNLVRVFDRRGIGGVPTQPAAYIVLISNRLLDLDGPMHATTAASVLADQTNSGFTYYGSLVVRVRPGEHPKTAWSALPEGSPAQWATVRSGNDGPPA